MTYSIGRLAAEAGVPVSTVRYYEREGLLVPQGRTRANYRIYGDRSLERLRFIRAAQTGGLALEDVSALLALQDGGEAPCREVQELLQRRLAQTEARLAGLRRVRSVLRSSLASCQEAAPSGRCSVIDGLQKASTGRGTAARRRRAKEP